MSELMQTHMERIKSRPIPTPEEIAEIERRQTEYRERQEERRRHEMLTSFLNRAGSRSREMTLAKYTTNSDYQKRCLDEIKDWANGGHESLKEIPNVVLYGPVGTGKDHLAVGACGAMCIHHGITVKFLSVQDWFGDIRDAMDDDRQSESSMIQEWAGPELLLISDPLPPFGNLTQHQSTMFYRLVARRASERKATVVTINVKDDAEAYERIGAPTWNRIIEGALLIHCNWQSFRQPYKRITNVKS